MTSQSNTLPPLHLSDFRVSPAEGWTAYCEEVGGRVPLPWEFAAKRETVIAHQVEIGNVVSR